MCGINIFNKLNSSLEEINKYCKNRGPDHTNIESINNITFIHNLLSITGSKIIQPIKKDNVVLTFNGEIYNYQTLNNNHEYENDNNEENKYKSDGEAILDLYLNNKYYDIEEYINKLDGEFAIVIVDFNLDKLFMITDPFATKPLFYSLNGKDFMISSYSACITNNNFTDFEKVDANTCITINLIDNTIINKIKLHKFDYKQFKINYNDWITAFEKSIKKRINTNKKIFVSLSSGYDSGAISCQINKEGKSYTSYSVYGKEDPHVINNRCSINQEKIKQINQEATYLSKKFHLNEEIVQNYKKRNQIECCDFTSIIRKNEPTKKYGVLKDRASCGGSFIYSIARNDNCIINLSGQGADEILSDYGFNGNGKTWHSCFGGKFTNDLQYLVENKWESFQGGINTCLLMKEEIISGSWGIESRYPFLDKELVQEFLWLTPELKNKYYKAPLHYYLTINNYPFKINSKIGFNCLY